jgi:hypothetical protein
MRPSQSPVNLAFLLWYGCYRPVFLQYLSSIPLMSARALFPSLCPYVDFGNILVLKSTQYIMFCDTTLSGTKIVLEEAFNQRLSNFHPCIIYKWWAWSKISNPTCLAIKFILQIRIELKMNDYFSGNPLMKLIMWGSSRTFCFLSSTSMKPYSPKNLKTNSNLLSGNKQHFVKSWKLHHCPDSRQPKNLSIICNSWHL